MRVWALSRRGPLLGIYRVLAGSNSDGPNDRTLMLSDPPTVRNWLGKIIFPAFDKFRRYRPVCPRHQFAIPGIP